MRKLKADRANFSQSGPMAAILDSLRQDILDLQEQIEKASDVGMGVFRLAQELRSKQNELMTIEMILTRDDVKHA